jgi:hypothetical protein
MRLPVAVAILAAAPMGFFAVRAAALTVRDLADPCYQWSSTANGGSAGVITAGNTRTYRSSAYLPPPGSGDRGCPSGIAGSSSTRSRAIFWAVVCPGGILLAIALGVTGTLRRKPIVTLCGGALMIVKMAPTVFSLAPLALATGAVYCVLGFRQRRERTA